MLMMRYSCLIPVVAATLLAGCHGHSTLPIYPSVHPQVTLDMMAARADRLHALTAAVDAKLTRTDGQSIRLDGAMAIRQPDHLRLQLWKLSRTTFDLTVRPDGVWLWQDPSSPPARAFPWLATPLTGGNLFRSPSSRRLEDGLLTITRELDHDVTLHAVIDPVTQTLRECRAMRGGDELGRMILDAYRVMDGHTIPTRWILRGSDGEIELVLRDIELNGLLGARAFDPSPRAVRLELEP